MTIARNNDNNLFDPKEPKDRNETGSFPVPAENGRKSIWFQVHRLFNASIDDGDVFQKHAESMRRFRKSHVPNRDTGAICRRRVPILNIDVTASEKGRATVPMKASDRLLLLPEYKASPHQFLPN